MLISAHPGQKVHERQELLNYSQGIFNFFFLSHQKAKSASSPLEFFKRRAAIIIIYPLPEQNKPIDISPHWEVKKTRTVMRLFRANVLICRNFS